MTNEDLIEIGKRALDFRDSYDRMLAEAKINTPNDFNSLRYLSNSLALLDAIIENPVKIY